MPVVCGLEVCYAPVCRLVGIVVFSQIEVNAAELAAVFLYMPAFQFFEATLKSLVQGFFRDKRIVAADVIVVFEVCGNGEEKCSLVGIFNLQHAVFADE